MERSEITLSKTLSNESVSVSVAKVKTGKPINNNIIAKYLILRSMSFIVLIVC